MVPRVSIFYLCVRKLDSFHFPTYPPIPFNFSSKMGRGKTYTTVGSVSTYCGETVSLPDFGIIPRVIQHALERQSQRHLNSTHSISIQMSCIQLYQKNAYDLLKSNQLLKIYASSAFK